ncbi:DUF4144 domain-containing protein [Shewanella chilikensis]|uniref:DUF4144 domain-containing protein n=1 Tax=Shewanella chilikensis TaxID=558541 RepID=UPI001F3A0118|nr:DUF4144 domain-containing protein [Shewanella chilikensis]MCE9789658.1 DUF4144 domain-containing protein [Shewanella chilikensis]
MTQPTWPAILKPADSDELLFLENERDWLEYICLHQHLSCQGDQLIDSGGLCYPILPATRSNEPVLASLPQIGPSQSRLELTDLKLLVQKHAAALGSCCVAKLAFITFPQGLEMVRYLDNL